MTTVGFGDITPVGQTARLVLVQMIFNVVVIASAVRVGLRVVRRSRQE